MAQDLLTREAIADAEIRVREDAGDQRIIDLVATTFGVTTTVPPDPSGPRSRAPYRERILPGATEGLDPADVTLEAGRHGGPIVGRGVDAQVDGNRLLMSMLVSRTAAGDELYQLARDGVYRRASIVFVPRVSREAPDGVVERTQIDVRRVAVLERGAYPGAEVLAVRAAEEDTMAEQTTAPEAGAEQDEQDEATPAPAGERRPNRTRVTVDVERAAVERGEIAELTRGAGPTIRQTGGEQVYGPGRPHSFFRDGWAARNGDPEAAARIHRHYAMLDDAVAREAATGDLSRWQTEPESGLLGRSGALGRAGDFLSSEAGGAYPNTYLPGLLTPRILKGRPMGGFYNNFPINNAAPIIFPKVTTSTVVAAQSAEGAALSATDIASTAVTTTPTMYGAYVDVSRQLLDGGNPAADAMLYADLLEAYSQVTEGAIKTAVEAGSSASGVAITAATPFAGTLANVVGYYGTRFKPAGAQFIPSALFSTLLAQLDTTGRPLLPYTGAINSSGTVAEGGSGANLLGARTILSWASTANVVVTGAADDFAVFESPVVRFSYDQVVGPQAVRIGIWAYIGIGTRLGSLKVTAA